jgi:hypothetical protein
VTNNAISTDAALVVSKSTPFDATNGDYSTNCLDKHDVQCPENHVLVNFKLVRGGTDNTQLQYHFKCSPATVSSCVTKTTEKADVGNISKTTHLLNQSVGPGFGAVSATQVLAGFHMQFISNNIWYQYTLCTIANNSARRRKQ